MTARQLTRAWFLTVLLLLGVTGMSAAASLVSVKADGVNMRAGPSMKSEVLWELGAGYPLKVLGRKGNWVQVVDFENDRGWVSRRYVSTARHAIVKSPRANLRAGPGRNHRIVGRAEYGDVFRVLGSRAGWVRVQGEDASRGWIAGPLLWGP